MMHSGVKAETRAEAADPEAGLGAASELEDELVNLAASPSNPVPKAAEEIIQAEGTVPPRPAPGQQAQLTAWLFQPEATPRRLAAEDVPGLIAEDANFVWIDLTDYTEQDLRA